MWGADTQLVVDALQIAALAFAVGAGGLFVALKLRRRKTPASASPRATTRTDLEERVQVLERIATDRTHHLAEEIEQLRDTGTTRGKA
ncbi:MAG: hypothetical protein AAGK01_11470 [Pseudomonadota bacterium]